MDFIAREGVKGYLRIHPIKLGCISGTKQPGLFFSYQNPFMPNLSDLSNLGIRLCKKSL